MLLSERLKIAMRAADVSQADLARACGVKAPSVSGWLSGKSKFLRGENLLRAAAALGVSQYWLATGEGEMKPSNANVKMSGVYIADMTKCMVPVISSIRAGTWGEINDHLGESAEKFPVREANVGPNAFALRVEGDSMTSSESGLTFPEGTVLIVDPDRAAKAGDYVVAKDVDTQKATFKRLTTDGARWYLKPLNRDYRPIEIDDPAVRVIGVVVEYWMGGKI